MHAFFSRKFRKRYARLPLRLRSQTNERLQLFAHDPFNPILDNHPLHGKYDGCRSINITGDYRAIYYHETETMVRFIALGTHAELYGK